ncbi:MAG TPA: 5-oxopent-3-ene-1,2,5-tricarboxylate decarboxylase, partial [Gammaproteobacteria bacterium]|nr:5-oxopent-3-ene-1,2,5-tricarboxylate decarboxylase [Gammaproteobacteria bacterium]
MKLVSFENKDGSAIGVVDGENYVIDLTNQQSGIDNLQTILELNRLGDLSKLEIDGQRAHIDELALLPVVQAPSKIICVGINYVAHAAEAGRKVGEYPVIFQRYADTLIGHGQTLLRPKVSEQFDFEGELAVIIGKGGSHIDPANAMDHVAGYSCFNDASIRDWQFHTHQYGMGKNFRCTGALGPWLVTADEIPDYRELRLRSYLNGELMQEGKLDQLAFDIPHIISYVSQALPWRPGDVIATGTPSGVGFKREPPLFLKAGDEFQVHIPGIG